MIIARVRVSWEVKQALVDIPLAQFSIADSIWRLSLCYVCDQHSFYLPLVCVLSQRTTPKHKKTKTVKTVSSQLLPMLWLDYEMVKFRCLRDRDRYELKSSSKKQAFFFFQEIITLGA